MPLLALPNEILLSIAHHLELERDINAFTRINRRLYYLVNTYLYRCNVQRGGNSALFWAATHGQEVTARNSLDQGADVKATRYLDRVCTPLLLAAERGHEAVMLLLVGHKDVDVNVADDNGQTPLLFATKKGYEAVVRLLLQREGVNANSCGPGHRSPLWWATDNKHEVLVRLLIEHRDVDVNLADDCGRTPLLLAVKNGY